MRTAALRLEFVGPGPRGRAIYELTTELVCTLDWDGDEGVRISVPAGYRTDLASVPRPFWSVFPPSGAYAPAAVVHDYLCDRPCVCSRFLADAIFRELMAELGVPRWKRLAIYYAVRLYGAFKARCHARVS